MRSGFSLLELLVVVTIVALVVGVVGIQWTPPLRRQRMLADSVRDVAASAARIAIGRDSTGAGVVRAAAYPDGRVIADSGENVQ